MRLTKMPVMRAAAENRRRKRVHDTYLCLPAFTEMHKYVSPGLYGLTLQPTPHAVSSIESLSTYKLNR